MVVVRDLILGTYLWLPCWRTDVSQSVEEYIWINALRDSRADTRHRLIWSYADGVFIFVKFRGAPIEKPEVSDPTG